MKKIYFVTTNPLKIAIGKSKVDEYAIELLQKDLETPEIQSKDVSEVSAYSAKFAAEALQVPVVATDAGLHIKALNGFPGPFIKYINHWFSSQDFLNLMKEKDDRSVYWNSAISYCEPGEEPLTFTSQAHGVLVEEAFGDKPGKVIQEIIKLDGIGKVGALASPEEIHAYWVKQLTAWEDLLNKLESLGKIQKKI